MHIATPGRPGDSNISTVCGGSKLARSRDKAPLTFQGVRFLVASRRASVVFPGQLLEFCSDWPSALHQRRSTPRLCPVLSQSSRVAEIRKTHHQTKASTTALRFHTAEHISKQPYPSNLDHGLDSVTEGVEKATVGPHDTFGSSKLQASSKNGRKTGESRWPCPTEPTAL